MNFFKDLRLVFSLFFVLLSVGPLAAGQDAEAEQRLLQYEQEGNYAAALDMVRECRKEAIANKNYQEAHRFTQIEQRLEKEWLTYGFTRLLFDEHFQPRPKLFHLLKLVGMTTLNEKTPLWQINAWAQQHLLRKGERWQVQTSEFERLKDDIHPLLSELGFIHGSSPHFDKYQGAIVHGALLPRLRLRLNYLVDQWKQGIRFSHLYFLSGERPLEAQEKNDPGFACANMAYLPNTECEMAKFVWDQSVPEEMRQNVSVHFICAPMKQDAQSQQWLRPTTGDTIESWLKESPPAGLYLAITNAPYIHRQDLTIKTLSPKGYFFDTVGPAAHAEEKMAILLDELGRLIFQTVQWQRESASSPSRESSF
jgi:hypothetical protein